MINVFGYFHRESGSGNAGRYLLLFGIVGLWSSLTFADSAPLANAAAGTQDTLVFKNGDRLAGKVISRTEGLIVFKTDRFGDLQVKENEAIVLPAEKPPAETSAAGRVPGAESATPSVAEAKAKKESEEAEKVSVWEFFSPSQLTAAVRRFFGPYHGKVAFSTEAMRNTTNRQNLSLEGRIRRTWSRDEFQLNSRYSFSQTNDITTTDLLNVDGLWRHTFKNEKYFAIYRPSVEANHAYRDKNLVPADYILLQQEIGLGRTVLSTPAYQLRSGISENIFTNWVITTDNHLNQTVESAYIEAEAKLPWRMTLSDRSVYYYALGSGKDGFENKFELDKKFTETLSVGVHYEARYNNPDVRSADYTLLRLVFGFDY